MKSVSVICTTYNEEHTIARLLDALKSQAHQPSEVIICDSQSKDNTQEIIKKFITANPSFKVILLSKQGNRSIGRNTAIAAAKSDLIAITDAGCIPEKYWLQELVKAYSQSNSEVIAGYYRGLPSNPFEEAVIPYVLVMPDRIDERTFLPATRSVLLEKKVWKALGGFDETLSLNEDYPFAKKLKGEGYHIAFAKNAVVGWLPRKNILEFITMIERFAQGDIEAKIFRPKVLFLFFRYLILLLVIIGMLFFASPKQIIALLLVFFVLYSIWAIEKNVKYTKNGWYWLPVLQYAADYAVIKGSLKGLLKS